MKSITIRDFRTRPKQAQAALGAGSETLLTSSGKPIAVMIPVDSESVEATLAVIRRARAFQALQEIREAARIAGADQLSPTAINSLIKKTRKRRPR